MFCWCSCNNFCGKAPQSLDHCLLYLKAFAIQDHGLIFNILINRNSSELAPIISLLLINFIIMYKIDKLGNVFEQDGPVAFCWISL
jgi:hypothetical protein